MNSEKQDDIFWSIDVIHDKNSSPKNKKNALLTVHEHLQEASHAEILNGNWQQVIEEVCAPVFIRCERTDLRNLASKIVVLIGNILFKKSDFEQFHDLITSTFSNTSKRYEDPKAELISCFSHIIGSSSHADDILCEKHVEICLQWILDTIPSATSLIYQNGLKTIVVISTVYPKTFESKLDEIMNTLCANLDESDKNFELLVESIESFQIFLTEKPCVAERLCSELIRKTEIDMRRRMKMVLILIRATKSKNVVGEINEAIGRTFETPDWSPAVLSAFCPIFSELLLICKEDVEMVKRIEGNIEMILKSASFSESATNDEHYFVEFLSEIVKHLPADSDITRNIIELVFDEQTGLFNSKTNRMSMFTGRRKLYKETVELISNLLTPKSLPFLQSSFSAIRRIVLESIERLRNVETHDSDILRWNEAVLIILLSSLNSISCAKSSLIVMMGIRPSIFEFLVTELPLTEHWFVRQHPAVYHVLLHILVSHLKSHEYYLAQSEYVQQGDSVGQTKREYAKFQVVAMEKILRFDGETMPSKIRFLIISWISAFITMATGMNLKEDVYRRKEWIQLRTSLNCQSALTWNCEGIPNIVGKLSTVMTWTDTDNEKENEVAETTKRTNWKDAGGIWEAGNSKTYIRQSVNGMYQAAQETQQKSVQTTTFGTEEFTIITNFLLKSIVPTTFRKGSYNWMDEMLDSMTSLCSVVGDKKKMEISDKFFDKWRWVLNQTANYCIINKMKTPLGKPMETFSAFSSEINKLAKQVLTNRKSSKDSKNETDGGHKSTLRYTIQWCRVRLLIELIDILDKMMCCAMYGGASFNMSEIPALSRQFFTTNVQSCVEWLNRTYYSALVVSYYNGNYALTIRFGWSALRVYQKRARDEKTTGLAVTICCWMCRAMTALSAPQSVTGMRRWMRKEFATELAQNVMEAMELMAASRYEMALFNFDLILRNDQTISETVKLIIHNCVIDLLNRLRNMDNIDYYKSLLFEQDDVVTEDFKSVELLTKFEKIDVKEKRHILDWNVRQKSMAIEASFTQTMRKVEINDIKRDLSQMGALLLNADASCRLYSDISSTNLVVSYLVDKMNGLKPKCELTTHDLFDNDDYDEGERLTAINKIVSWAKHLHTSRGISGDCYAELVRHARKTDNRNLAVKMMMLSMKFGVSPWMSLENAKQDLKLAKNEELDRRILKMTGVFATFTDLFMMNCKNKQNLKIDRAPAEFYGEFISLNYEERLKFIRRCDESMSRVALQLSDFFNNFHEHEQHLLPHFSQTFLWHEIHQRKIQLGVNYRGFVGALLSMSTEMCPELAKTHLKFAQWAYQLADVQYVKEMNAVYQHITLHTDPEINNSLWKCLECSTLGQLENEIRKLIGSTSFDVQSLLSPEGYYLNMWANVKEHRTKYLTISATSYFQFIHASGGALPYSKKEEITVATLRILDMLVRNGDLLIEIIEKGLSTTNVNVWKEILPQLFARLSHPSEHVRTTLVNLVSRICAVSPHSVVFQVVSGAASSSSTFASEEEEAEEIDEQAAHDDDRNKVRDCCEQLESRLAEQYPKLVADVRKFVGELERINLLNEEKWDVVLGTMEHEMEKRIALIRAENAKTQKAAHLSDEQRAQIMAQKTKLMTSQVFDVLDELYDKTCLKPAHTENEKQFQSTFAEQIAEAFNVSKQNRMNPEKAWQPFRNLVSLLVHRTLKRGMQTFEIQNISPYLSFLSDSFVPMPGQDSVDFDNVVTISRVAKQVTVLPTKTRPKKLAFVGSDGKACTFLFKGREDLHLDERVMQFLRLCNIMLTSGRQYAEYQAHNYAVIPLGPRSGLIKWVEGATPLFHIYRKWQVRDRAHRQAIQKNGEHVSDNIERPSDMYHRMVRHVVNEHKIDPTIASDRSKWPSDMMNKVHQSLVDKTPNDLLSREFWIRSGCATTWWKVSNRFARSCSVMSMIGAVLGLGDRHLDNLLVDLNHGNIIHIDYNICFDKGRNLRIPETVPFRLTQNMMHALGPAMIDGVFRESCIHVLQTLRNGKQVLTMLLDAFVYDPLVDWTNHESISSGISLALKLAVYGAEWKKKTLHAGENNALEMFKLRIVELKHEWLQNKEDLKKSILSFSDALLLQNEMQKNEASRLMLQAVTKHHSLMKCLRPLIRTISKENAIFVNYYAMYKKLFNEPLLKAHSAMPDEKQHVVNVGSCVRKFSAVLENIDKVFDGLLGLTMVQSEVQSSAKSSTTTPPPPGLENVWLVKEDQVENMMARQIVQCVERRLDGFKGNTVSEPMTPMQQADYLISEATNINNLSKMYEGWTAWV